MMAVPEARRRELASGPVTLNGERAVVTGVKNVFATVIQVDTGLGCEFSWEAVEYVITNNSGSFKS